MAYLLSKVHRFISIFMLTLLMIAFGLYSGGGIASEKGVESGAFIDLSGSTRHPVLPNGEISAHIGGFVSSAIADSNGEFEISIDCSESDQLVVIRAKGIGDQNKIEHARLVHSCGYLQKEIDAEKGFRTGPLSPLSTAAYAGLRWFIAREESLSWPITLSQIKPYLNIIQLDNIYSVIAAISHITAGDVDLPPGINTTVELALNRREMISALAQGNQSVSFDEQRPRLQAIHWDSRLYRRPSSPSAPELTSKYCVTLSRNCSLYFDLFPDQTMRYGFTGVGGIGAWVDRGLQAVIFGDRMQVPEDNLRAFRMNGKGGEPLSVAIGFPFIDGQQVLQRSELLWTDIRIADASELISVLSSASKRRLTYPENPEISDTVFESTLVSFSEGLTSLANLPTWQGPQAGEAWVLPILNELPFFSNEQIVSFNGDGTAFAQLSGVSLDWSYKGDILSLSGEDFPEHQIYFLGGIPGRHDSVFVEVSENEKAFRAFQGEAINVDSALAFSSKNVTGRYLSGLDLDAVIPDADPARFDEIFAFDLFSDGTGLNGRLVSPSSPMPAEARSVIWEIDVQGRLVISISSGTLSVIRRWTQVALSPLKDDIYLVETNPEFVAEGEDPTFANSRLNFYRKMLLP